MEPVLFRLESDGNKEPVSCSSPSAMYRGRHVKRALGPLDMSIQLHDHQPVPKREPVRAHLRCPWPVGLSRLAERRFFAEIKGKAPLDPITILVKASRQSGLFDRVCTQESGARLAASYLVTRETLEKPSVEQVHADMTYLKQTFLFWQS